MARIDHPVRGLEHNENWIIAERGIWYTPRLNGRPLMRRDGKAATVATYRTYDDAVQAVQEFLGRMQAGLD